jgi:chromosome segregation ATPase
VEGVIERHKKSINDVDTQLKWFVAEQNNKWQSWEEKQRGLQAEQDKLKEGFSVMYRDLNLLPEDLHHARDDIEGLKEELAKTSVVVKKQLEDSKNTENQTVLDLRTDLSDLAGVVENIASEMRKTQDTVTVTKQVIEAEIDRRRREDVEDIEIISLKKEPISPESIALKKEPNSPPIKSPSSLSPIPSFTSVASVSSTSTIVHPQDVLLSFPSSATSVPQSNSGSPRRSPRHLESFGNSNISLN